ncbi:MAG: RNA polymerase sigma factor [Paenisporosarcina sp.]
MQDTEMIDRAQNGDKLAYGELMDLYYRTIEKFAFQCGVKVDDIQDLTQEVFIELYRFLPQFQREQFTTWLYKITLNATRDYYRKEKLEKEENLKLQDKSTSGVSTRSSQSRVLVFEEDRELHEAIQLLEEKYRNPIILFYFHELSLEQIGEILNIPTATVETRLLSSKEQLKTALSLKGGAENGR